MKACEAFEYILIFERILFFAHPRWDFGAMTGSEGQTTPPSRGVRLTLPPAVRIPFRTPGAFVLLYRCLRLSYRWGIRIRFRPNRRASTDHAPGPIIARAAPNAASTMCIEPLLEGNTRRDSWETVKKRPATGVHSPMVRSAEQMAARNWKMTETGNAAPWEPATNWTSGIVAAARKNSNPVPGQPSGNVEKSLCTSGPVLSLAARLKSRNPEKRIR